MLELRELSLQRGGVALFDDVTLTLFPGQRVGITGANGSGKSSLFALLLDRLQPDRGELRRPPSWVIAHVAQETPAVEHAALDYVLDGDIELRRVQRQLADIESSPGDAHSDGTRLAELHGRLDAIGGYDAQARAGRLLAGLGFSADDQQRPVSDFSGGWRMRLNLAQALMCRSDLLLLDEPTNHLDLDTVLWLEQWLKVYPGTLLLISHDRDFLDAVVGHVAHLYEHRLTLYTGHYSAFESQRAARLAQQQAAYEKQQREVAHLRSFVDRFRAKASKARQAQSRIKALAKLENIALAHVNSPFRFRFRTPEKLPSPLLGLAAASAGYAADKPVLNGLKLSLQPGQRLGLLGPNGAGKSTLIKLLAGQLEPLTGERLPADGLRVGYFAQHQLEQLRPERTPLQHVQDLDAAADGRTSEQVLRDFLGGFGFGGQRADRDVAPFSGGEKARLALALLVWQRPNLLLLDEPTNHLDLDMRHALNVALQEFTGALIIVSHDRHLLRTATDELWLISAGRAQSFDGDLDDYRDAQHRVDGTVRKTSGEDGRRERRRRDAEQRAQLSALLKPLKTELTKIDRRMETLNGEKKCLETELADPVLYQEDASKPRLQTLLVRQGEVGKELGDLEARWFELHEQLDELSAAGDQNDQI